MAGLSDLEAAQILYDWDIWARAEQRPPPGNWYVWLLRSGRGAGKTRTGAEWIIRRAREGHKRIALIGQTKADVRDTMIELNPASIMQISPPWFRPEYEPSKRRVVWPNGAIGIAYSGDEPDQLRGPEFDTAWVDELCKFKFAQATWDNLEMALRTGVDPRVIVTTTPRPIPVLKRLLADPQTVDMRCSTYANRANLSARTLERLEKRYAGTRLGRQELEGEVLEDNPNALWRRGEIEAHRVTQHPELVRVVVGVDPEATSTEGSAETGILVAGRGKDGHGYILDDLSIQGTPGQWGAAAVTAYHKHRADRIVAEVNQGGEMVEHTIHTVDRNVAYTAVHASRGKTLRAEPISAMYEQGRWHHVGTFPDLEDQMCEWVPGDKSPDRLDALVWAATALMFDAEEVDTITTYDSLTLVGSMDL